MNEQLLFERCLKVASEIVEAYRLPYEYYNFDIGGGESQGSTVFRRKGTSDVTKSYTLPSDLADLIRAAYTGSQIPSSMTGNDQSLLNTLLTQSSTSVPGLSTLQEAQGIDPLNFRGLSSLQTMTDRNPYSKDYENAVGSLYDRMFAKGRVLAQSGPGNVRGGTARQGFELAELDSSIGRNKFKDVREQQDREAGVVQQAIQMMNAIEGLRRGTRLQSQGQQAASEHSRKQESLGASQQVANLRSSNLGNVGLAAELLGKPKQSTLDDVRGRGQQVTQQSNWGAGLTCCFTFIEALEGRLPDVVRQGRDAFHTENRRAGYVWMSSWLVPVMKRSRSIRWLVRNALVKPFITVGRWQFNDSNARNLSPILLWPYCWAWLLLWSMLGWLDVGVKRKDLLLSTI